jgi:hypothetical protein
VRVSADVQLQQEIKLVWRDLSASTDQQAADVLEFLSKNP